MGFEHFPNSVQDRLYLLRSRVVSEPQKWPVADFFPRGNIVDGLIGQSGVRNGDDRIGECTQESGP